MINVLVVEIINKQITYRLLIIYHRERERLSPHIVGPFALFV